MTSEPMLIAARDITGFGSEGMVLSLMANSVEFLRL